MEFKFNINELFKTPIVEIGSNLIPPGFQGDRRQLWDVVTKVSEVINTIGQASASAQGLTKPITTAERLRNAENQRLYLLIDRNAKTGKGGITGMLKTGKKGLYVFDREGQHYQVQPNCVLDFYIHESRQRTGLGKHLFEHMLQKEEVDPVKLAIDRPSDKFLAFLKKHYNLEAAIRQMNNYVVFEGFFPEQEKLMSQQQSTNNNTDTPTNRMTTTIHLDKRGSNGLQQQTVTSPYGRYGAPRPPCSMGQIIHNQSAVVGAQEPTGCSLNMKPSKERSAYTLRRASRHANEELRKQYYAPPRFPFYPCPAVGNGLGNTQASHNTNQNVTCSPTLQESNIQLVSKDQMMRAILERQNQAKLERPPSILQNLPSPAQSRMVNNNNNNSNAVNSSNVSLVQQNIKVFDGANQSNLIRSPSGLNPPNQNGYQYVQPLQVGPVPVNLRLCDAHSRILSSAAPTLPNVEPNETRILRPKPLITDPLKEYTESPQKSTVNINNTNGESLMPNKQNCLHQANQQAQNVANNLGDQRSNPNVYYWQNQIYQSRDAPSTYPFVNSQTNPNQFYMSHEECSDCIQQQQEAKQNVKNEQVFKKQQEATIPAVPNTNNPNIFQFDQKPTRSSSAEQKIFPNDFQQQNIQQNSIPQDKQGYYQLEELIIPPTEGQLVTPNDQFNQQSYQSNSHNINPPTSYQQAKYPLMNNDQETNLYQPYQQQKFNMMPNNFTSGTNTNLYQPLPTIAEAESEHMISSNESVQQNSEAVQRSRTPHQSVSKFNANLQHVANQDIPFNTERKSLQEISPRSQENIKMNVNQTQHEAGNQYYQQPQAEYIPYSPRYNQGNVSSAVTSQNIGNFDVQSPRLNQYLTQQQQAQKFPQQDYNYEQENVDYSQQYFPVVNNQQQEHVQLRPPPLYQALAQNVGNFEQQSPRLNLNSPTYMPKEADAVAYPPPPPQSAQQIAGSPIQQKPESYHQKSNSITSMNQEQIPQKHLSDPKKVSTSNLKCPNPNNRSYSPTRFPYSIHNPMHKSPINHLEYNYTPAEMAQNSRSSFEQSKAPNDKSEQVKPNCLPERTPRLNSAQASASTQINIPKNVGNVQPISPGYNELSMENYKNMQQQDVLSRNVVSPTNMQQNVKSYRHQQEREPRYDPQIVSAIKIDRPHIPTMKGDAMAIPSGGQTRPVEMRETQDIPSIIQQDDQSNDIAADDDNDDDHQHQSGLKFFHGEKLERPRSLSLHTNDDDSLGFIENGTRNLHMAEEPMQKKLDIHSLDQAKKATPSHLTEQGYFDLKFYHNKLW